MKKTLLIGLLVTAVVAYAIIRRLGLIPGNTVLSPISIVSDIPAAISDPQTAQSENSTPVIEEFVTSLEVPWSIVFTSQNRMLVTERPGRLRVIENGKLLEKPLQVFNQVSSKSEEGLMGLAIDPSYVQNKYIYLCYAYERNEGLRDRVVRFIDNGSSLSNETIIIDNIPAAQFHAGCRLQFGPDQKLYITTGDATQKQQAQDKNSLAGKILRLNADGSIPSDNPFPNSPIWSFGHRNPQGITWDPVSGTMWETEHGPSGSDGPGGGDEVNVIVKGENYGWPAVSHQNTKAGLVSPKLVFTPAIAPGSAMVYSGKLIQQWKQNLFFGMLRGEGIMRVELDSSDPTKVTRYEKLEDIAFGRIREVMEGPDGSIYFTTSNQDGRGRARTGDDKIYRISF